MYDDDEGEEEVVQIFEVPFEEEYDEQEEADETPDAFAAKGVSDRALVDQQAKDADRGKEEKRKKLAVLKQALLSEKSELLKKERVMHELEQEIAKERYLNTRRRVADARHEEPSGQNKPRELIAEQELDVTGRVADEKRKEGVYQQHIKEVTDIRTRVAEHVRAIALLEQELLRS